MWLKTVIFILVLGYSGKSLAENSTNVQAAGFGYEQTIAGLDSLNYNIHNDYLRSREQFETLRAELEDIRESIRSIEAIEQRQGRTLSKLASESEQTATNEARLMNTTSLIRKLQQMQPTTEMINDLVLRFLVNSTLAQSQLMATKETKAEVPQLRHEKLPETCSDVGGKTSGVYWIQPVEGKSFEAFCDQEYEDGGWTVIQNRYDGKINFYRGWADYEHGFGNLREEFWLGLEQIHLLTSLKHHELHIVMKDHSGKKVTAKYSHFMIDGANNKYTLSKLGNFNGDAGDSLSYHLNSKFTTLDADHDTNEDNCAVDYHGAWWYKSCHYSNLNGLYEKGTKNGKTMCWNEFKGTESLKASRMMIKTMDTKRTNV